MKKSFLFFALLNLVQPSYPCTMFATFEGTSNSIIAAKNRDNRPDKQIIQVVAEPGKLKYLALSRAGVPNFVSAGINERNLAVFNEVTIEYAKQAKGGIDADFSKDILQKYSKAQDVIPDLPKLVAKYPDPVFYQIVDNKQILVVEVGSKQKYSFRLYNQGVVTHTNNYLESSLIKGYPYTEAEKARVLASQTRLERAKFLLAGASDVSLADMQRISLDRNAGSNDSIYRVGDESNPSSVKSLAFFAVKIAKDGQGSSEFNAYLYSQGSRYAYVLNKHFWSKYQSGYSLINPNEK